MYGGGDWEVRVKGNTTRRPDGTINSSPITSSTPIVRLQHGCDHIYRIPGRHVATTSKLNFFHVGNIALI